MVYNLVSLEKEIGCIAHHVLNKWDAPGAMKITDPTTNITSDRFVFTANGEHSGMRYKYTLDLDLFLRT